MVQAGDGARLALESVPEIRVVRKVRGKDLDGDGSIEAGVPPPVDFSHPAGADEREDLVRAETCAGGERHFDDIIVPRRAYDFGARAARLY
jgi:hypothetical protein